MDNAAWTRWTTTRGTAHLFKFEEGRFGAYWLMKCNSRHYSSLNVQMFLEGDKVCARCFPPAKTKNGKF